MKKGLSIGLVSILAIGSLSPTALAATNNVPINVLAADYQETEKIDRSKVVKSLTLEEAIQYALNKNYSLKELEYQIENLKITKIKLEDLYWETEDDLDDVRDQQDELEDLLDMIPAPGNGGGIGDGGEGIPGDPAPSKELEDIIKEQLEGYEKNKQLQQNLNLIDSSISTLESALTSLEDQLEDLEYSETTLENTRAQTRETIKMSIVSNFVTLLLLQNQIELLEKTHQIQQSQTESTKKRFELGVLSSKDAKNADRDLTNFEKEIELLETELKNNKAIFASTIGLTYDGDYTLVEPELGEVVLVEQEVPTEELIKKSYYMKNANEELRKAQDKQYDVEDSDDSVDEDYDLAEIAVQRAKLNIESTTVELENAIFKLFTQIEAQFEAVKKAEEVLQHESENVKDLKLYYELGLVSKQDYESSTATIDQAQATYDNAKYQYYLLQNQVEALYNGIIIKN